MFLFILIIILIMAAAVIGIYLTLASEIMHIILKAIITLGLGCIVVVTAALFIFMMMLVGLLI